MNDNKSRDIFYGVVAIATLIVALIGATLAYFSITANSAEGAVTAKAATVSIIYEDGQARIAPAKNLIPVTFDKLQVIYSNNVSQIDTDYASTPGPNEDPRKNRCKDGANTRNGTDYDVCSSFRFSVSNDSQRNIVAMLRTEYNGFKYLAYAVRKVNCDEADENNCWLNLDFDDNDNPVKFVHLDTCNNGGDVKCYTEDENTHTKTYSALATKPIFGYTSPSDTTFKSISIAVTKHSYDVVLFINDDDTNQNDDQGQTYSGNIFIETANSNEKITGQLS